MTDYSSIVHDSFTRV